MDQLIGLTALDLERSIDSLSAHCAAAVAAAHAVERPFYHLRFDRVFPDQVYSAMLAAMPANSDYRPMSGRATENDLPDGTRTRVKIDLLPEYIRKLPPDKRAVWSVVGPALCSARLKDALVRRLAPGLQRRFGDDFTNVALYPLPILTRDIPGYHIYPHPDTHWKGITVQLSLPRYDSAIAHTGTVLHERSADGTLSRHTQLPFAPNSGYAFAVDKDTWHSADTVGPEVTTRDSILLTYFVDSGIVRYLRNRGKRIGNILLNGVRRPPR
jgi:hypothetical protein